MMVSPSGAVTAVRSPRGLVPALGMVQIPMGGSTVYLLAVLAPAIVADTGWPFPRVLASVNAFVPRRPVAVYADPARGAGIRVRPSVRGGPHAGRLRHLMPPRPTPDFTANRWIADQ